MSSRPNILYVFTDQQAAAAMSCAGNANVRTPNMDRLAERGTRFDRAYCAFPLCTPARASMFTGRYPSEVGINGNGGGIDEAARPSSLGRLFADAGYDCGYGGKWHLPEGDMPDANDLGFRTICGFNDDHLAAACADFIREPRDRPFLLVASFDNPHNICEYYRFQALPWGPVAEPGTLDDCPALPANAGESSTPPSLLRQGLRETTALLATEDYSDDEWRRARFAYLRLVEKVDAEIGKILDALDEAGLEDETVVVFSSDHGEMSGSHGWFQKSVLYEESIRIPLIVAPGGSRGPALDSHLVSNGLDLLPTLCDYADIDVPADLRGRSLRPLVDGATPPDWRERLMVQTVLPAPSVFGRAIVGDRYKYVVFPRGRHREQLFDLDSDPGEMINLAADPAHAEALAACRAAMQEALVEIDDGFGRHYSGYPTSCIPGYEYG